MKQPVYPNLFRPVTIKGLRLKNRITMAPLYLGYAGPGGTVSELLLDHYGCMAQSGAAMIVVENAAVATGGSGASRTLRCDHNRRIDGLSRLADRIKGHKCRAALQINHAGRFAQVSDPVAPSAVSVFGRTPRALLKKEITTIAKQFARAAWRARQAGFDLVELHGGTGYLLAQFVSPRSNRRSDFYGGSISERIRFPLEVLKRVQDAVGDYPVGYRFLADEWLPDGLRLEESLVLAEALAQNGVAYLSVMGGTYESFLLPEIVKKAEKPGYMAALAAAVKQRVTVPVIAAGRISTPARADALLGGHQADLVGLARMLWVDPTWPAKARSGRDRAIIKCRPACDVCFQLVMKGRPAFCPQWRPEKRAAQKALFQ